MRLVSLLLVATLLMTTGVGAHFNPKSVQQGTEINSVVVPSGPRAPETLKGKCARPGNTVVGIMGMTTSGDWTQTQYFKTPFNMQCPVWTPGAGESVVVRKGDGTSHTLPANVVLRDPYGRYRSSDLHNGCDYFSSVYNQASVPLARTQVYAAASGWVRRKGEVANGWGHYVMVNHEGNRDTGTDLCTVYAHLAEASSLSVGTFVSAGAVLGYVGQSGNAGSTWSHLHFEIISRDFSHRYDVASYMVNAYVGDYASVWESWSIAMYPSAVTRGNSIRIDVQVTRAYYDGIIVKPTKAVVRWRRKGTSTFNSCPAITTLDSHGNVVGHVIITSADYGTASEVEFYVESYKNSTNYGTNPTDNINAPPDSGHYYRIKIN